MKLLIIEDNLHLANDIRQYLSESNFVTEHAGNFKEAEIKISLYNYDAVILDLGLPDGNGLDLITIIKEFLPDCSILILTAKDAVEDKVRGLELGADDYMTKPFHKAELNARIHSILRRNRAGRSNILNIDDIKVDFINMQAYVNNNQLNLTRKEYDLLVYFMQNPNRILTKESIAEHLWGDHIDQADSFDFIYNHIKNLRKKIVEAGGKKYIQAMYGMGYRFTPAQPE
jgi:DNA-binding response OmpR family regulator